MSALPDTPLTSIRIPWIESLYCDHPRLEQWLEQQGSPLNLLNTSSFIDNIAELDSTLSGLVDSFTIHYAIKANKAACFVKAAAESGIGVDVASLPELQTAVAHGLSGDLITVTGVVKSSELVHAAIEADAILVVDHIEEFDLIVCESRKMGKQSRLAIRLSGFSTGDSIIASRFGMLLSELPDFLPHLFANSKYARLEGIHFHLPGYSSEARRGAVKECLRWVDTIHSHGGRIRFIDMGGGFPVRYLQSKEEWETFRNRCREFPIPGVSLADSYPYYNETTIGEFLHEILHGLRKEFRDRDLKLRCEPGRFLLSSSGATITRVASVKKATHDRTAVTCEINGTQLRPSRGEFLVDPILIPEPPEREMPPHKEGDFHLFGRYCSENDCLFRRAVTFRSRPVKGDIILFPNTAGYHMHFLETHGHGFPLAENLIVDDPENPVLDPSHPRQKTDYERMD